MPSARTLKPLPSKEATQFLKSIKEQWGADFSKLRETHALFRSPKDKIYLAHKDVAKVDWSRFRIQSIGLYIADVKGGQLRLSIEGSQLIGPKATKNVVDIDKDELLLWLQGKDLEKAGDWSNFVIIRYNKDYCGSGKYKEGMILNFVPKTRRVKELV